MPNSLRPQSTRELLVVVYKLVVTSNRKQLSENADFASLRQRDDFKRFVERLTP